MFSKLRRRFIVISTLVVFLIVGLLIAIMNLVNAVNTQEKISFTMLRLKEAEGVYDVFVKPSPPEQEVDYGSKYEIRFFTVTISPDGNEIESNLDHISALNELQAVELALPLFREKKKQGKLDEYCYDTLETGSGTMYIFLDYTKEQSHFLSYLKISVAVGAAGILLFFAVIVVASKIVVKPVAETYQKQRRFITDASHEIKTPLTVINADTEILEMQTGENEWTEGIKAEVKRLASLTEKLVYLAKLDEGAALNVAEFDLSELVVQTVRSFEGLSQSSGKPIRCEFEEGIVYRGDSGLIKQLVVLLFDNALKYSDERTEIGVWLTESSGKICFCIENKASDMQEGDLSAWFERFYRADPSRNSSTGGHGIGLSVAKAIVSAHKGKITATCKNGIVQLKVIL